MRLAWDRITWLAIRPWLSSHTTNARAAWSFKMRRPSSVDVAERIVALQGSRACSSSSLAWESFEMSSKIGGCIGGIPCSGLPANHQLQATAYSSSRQENRGALEGPASCLSRVVLLCNPYVANEAALFGSFEGTLLERGQKTLLADLSQGLEVGSEGQGGGGKG